MELHLPTPQAEVAQVGPGQPIAVGLDRPNRLAHINGGRRVAADTKRRSIGAVTRPPAGPHTRTVPNKVSGVAMNSSRKPVVHYEHWAEADRWPAPARGEIQLCVKFSGDVVLAGSLAAAALRLEAIGAARSQEDDQPDEQQGDDRRGYRAGPVDAWIGRQRDRD